MLSLNVYICSIIYLLSLKWSCMHMDENVIASAFVKIPQVNNILQKHSIVFKCPVQTHFVLFVCLIHLCVKHSLL